MTTKICSRPECACKGRPQPEARFGNNKQSPDGKAWYCLVCAADVQRAWKLANPRKVKAWKKRYRERQEEKHTENDHIFC